MFNLFTNPYSVFNYFDDVLTRLVGETISDKYEAARLVHEAQRRAVERFTREELTKLIAERKGTKHG